MIESDNQAGLQADQDDAASGSASSRAGAPPARAASVEGAAHPANRPADSSAAFVSHPIGAYLRRQRMLRGMSVEELASITRIPLRSLERLEGGQFDGETDGFVRGFVRTVASALGLDTEDTISRMLQEASPGAWERHPGGRTLRQGLAIAGFVLLLGGAFFVLRSGWSMLVGSRSGDASREVVVWYDPVRALAEAAGAPLDPAGEIDPSGRSTAQPVPGAARRGSDATSLRPAARR